MNRKYLDSKMLPEIFSLEKDVLEKEAKNSDIKGMPFNDQFIDIGVPEDYFKAVNILAI